MMMNQEGLVVGVVAVTEDGKLILRTNSPLEENLLLASTLSIEMPHANGERRLIVEVSKELLDALPAYSKHATTVQTNQ